MVTATMTRNHFGFVIFATRFIRTTVETAAVICTIWARFVSVLTQLVRLLGCICCSWLCFGPRSSWRCLWRRCRTGRVLLGCCCYSCTRHFTFNFWGTPIRCWLCRDQGCSLRRTCAIIVRLTLDKTTKNHRRKQTKRRDFNTHIDGVSPTEMLLFVISYWEWCKKHVKLTDLYIIPSYLCCFELRHNRISK